MRTEIPNIIFPNTVSYDIDDNLDNLSIRAVDGEERTFYEFNQIEFSEGIDYNFKEYEKVRQYKEGELMKSEDEVMKGIVLFYKIKKGKSKLRRNKYFLNISTNKAEYLKFRKEKETALMMINERETR